MFCDNCGNKLEQSAKFCPECGKKIGMVQGSVSQCTSQFGLPKTRASEGKGKLLYTSKGISQKRAVILIIASAVLLLLGTYIMSLSQSRYTGITVKSFMGSGVIGGGYRFNEEGRQALSFLGIICIAEGLINVLSYFVIKKSEFHVYENCICGVEYASILGIPLKKEFELEYYQIVEVQKNSNIIFEGLQISTATEKYGVTLKYSAYEPYQLIKTKMKQLS